MNKHELASHIASAMGVSKAVAEKFIASFTEAVCTQMEREGSVRLIGFGTWSAHERKGRTCRNPATGAPMSIPSRTVPVFKAGTQLKAAASKRSEVSSD